MSRWYEERGTKRVALLDNKRTETAALKVFAAQFGMPLSKVRKEGWKLAYPLVFTEVIPEPFDGSDGYTPDRQYAVICTEGVGWTSDAYQRITIPLHAGWIASNTVDVSWAVLREIAMNPENKPMERVFEPNMIELRDHVRKFGDRLESNFWLWHNRLIEPLTRRDGKVSA